MRALEIYIYIIQTYSFAISTWVPSKFIKFKLTLLLFCYFDMKASTFSFIFELEVDTYQNGGVLKGRFPDNKNGIKRGQLPPSPLRSREGTSKKF